jgi:type II secretory pathway pseudopilin PulG
MKNKNFGYSLVQLIIVLSIIAIVAGYFSFRFSGILDQIKLQSAAKMIQSDLMSAKMRAQAEHINQEIAFLSNQYSFNEHKKFLPSSVFVQNPQTIKFASSGMPHPGYFGTLKLICHNKTASIVISPLGRIRIE